MPWPIGVAAPAWLPVAGWMKTIVVSIRSLSLTYVLHCIARGKTTALSDELNGFRMTARTWVLVALAGVGTIVAAWRSLAATIPPPPMHY